MLKLKLKIYILNPLIISIIIVLCMLAVGMMIKGELFIWALDYIVRFLPIVIVLIYLICIYEEHSSNVIKMEHVYLKSSYLYLCDFIVFQGITLIFLPLFLVGHLVCGKYSIECVLIILASMFVLLLYSSVLFGIVNLIIATTKSFFISILACVGIHFLCADIMIFPTAHYLGEIKNNLCHIQNFHELFRKATHGKINICNNVVADNSDIVVLAFYCMVVNLISLIIYSNSKEKLPR